jgi:hypothetical protein
MDVYGCMRTHAPCSSPVLTHVFTQIRAAVFQNFIMRWRLNPLHTGPAWCCWRRWPPSWRPPRSSRCTGRRGWSPTPAAGPSTALVCALLQRLLPSHQDVTRTEPSARVLCCASRLCQSDGCLSHSTVLRGWRWRTKVYFSVRLLLPASCMSYSLRLCFGLLRSNVVLQGGPPSASPGPTSSCGGCWPTS